MVSMAARALVVDDNEAIRQQLTEALGFEGIHSDSAADGDEALRKCAERPYSVVVTDLRMPNLHGHALIVTLLKQVNRPKIVVFTGVTEPRIATDLLTRGIDAIVYKPVNYFDLATRVKSLLAPPELETPVDEPSEDAIEPEAEEQPPTAEVSESVDEELEPVEVPSPPPRIKKPAPPRVMGLRERVEQKLKQSSVVDPWVMVTLQSLDWRRYRNPNIEIPCFLREPGYAPTNGDRYQPEWGVVMNETVVALPIGEGMRPEGEPFKMIMHTLSKEEMSFVHAEPIDYSRLAIVWRGRDRSRVVAMLRNVYCRDHATVCEVIGQIEW